MRADSERLQDIAESIVAIEQYAVRGREVFEQDELIQLWIIHHLQRIGEAARGVSADLKNMYSNLPWADAIGLRNVLVYQYWKIDPEIIWSIVETVLPIFKAQIGAVLIDLSK